MKIFVCFLSNFFLDTSNSAFVCGNNSYHQLAENPVDAHFLLVEFFENVKTIALCENHSRFLKEVGSVWSTGSNGSKQLGTGTGLSERNHFEQVKF